MTSIEFYLIFFKTTSTEAESTSEKHASNDDFDKQLKEELDELKNADNEFKVIDAGAKYTIFITIPNVDVNKTSEKIYEFIKDSKKPLCRYLQRFVPILNTCKAYNEDIERCVEQLFDKIYDSKETIKYTCMFKSSNNSTLKRDDVIKIVNSYFQGKNSQNKVDFDQPDFVILIQVIRNICFISYLKEYFVYRKYNLVEMGIKYSTEQAVTENKNEVPQEKELNE
jgi:tRNA acetyltransferase TAN1